MKKSWVFLRSAHCGDAERHGPPPSNTLSTNEDMWTHLFLEALSQTSGVQGVMVRMGDFYEVQYSDRLREVRLPSLDCLPELVKKESLIINRGGYREYLPYLERHQGIPSIYIGAGRRWNPLDRHWSPWMEGVRVDVVLVDSAKQKETLDQLQIESVVFPKPALDTFFFSKETKPKKYDLVFNCHRPEEFKGGPWLAERVPDGCRVLVIGPENKWLERERRKGRICVIYTGKVKRQDVAGFVSQARVAVVCDDGVCDSGPRVLPEFLAMGVPVIVRNAVRVDFQSYINDQTGRLVGDDTFEFHDALKQLLVVASSGLGRKRIIRHYMHNLSMDSAGERFCAIIERTLDGA